MVHGLFYRDTGGEEIVIVDHLIIGSTRIRIVVMLVGVYLEWSNWNLDFMKGNWWGIRRAGETTNWNRDTKSDDVPSKDVSHIGSIPGPVQNGVDRKDTRNRP